MKIKTILIAALFCACAITTQAQSVTGTWKCLSNTLEYMNGKKEDMRQTILKTFPCAVSTKYFFKADGTHYSQSPKGCEMIDAMGAATWKQTGNTLLLTAKNAVVKKGTSTSYTVSFSGITMTLTHVYTDAENKISNTKVKQIIVVYQRI